MKKAERMDAFVDGLGLPENAGHHPCYLGYFELFNQGRYYEAHDVLEHLWLHGSAPENADFYKALIQIAGGFVHMEKQFLHPEHPKHGRRLRPASRLLQLGRNNLARYAPRHLDLDLVALDRLCADYIDQLQQGHFVKNPWSPEAAPRLSLAPLPDDGPVAKK